MISPKWIRSSNTFHSIPYGELSSLNSALLVPVGAKIIRKPSSVIVEEGQNVTLVCQATGQPTPTVTWRKAFSQLRREKTVVAGGNLTIAHIARADAGAYACVAKNLLGEDSAVALVTVISGLEFTLRPPVKVVENVFSSVMFNCTAQGSLDIVWKRAGQGLPQNHVLFPNGTLLLWNVSAVDAGTYICIAKNSQRSIEVNSVF